jgi:CheY-like chemotaxis protein
MAGPDGFALVRAVRRDDALCVLPILVLSAQVMPDLKVPDLKMRERNAGFPGSLGQPFDPWRLVEMVLAVTG